MKLELRISQIPVMLRSFGNATLKLVTNYPALLGFLFLSALLCLFYHKALFFNTGVLHPAAFATLCNSSFSEEAGSQRTYPPWNPYLNCGTPYFENTDNRLLNPVDSTIKIMLNKMHLPAFTFVMGNYLLLGYFLYLLLRSWNVKVIVCLFGSISVVFIPQFVAFVAYGQECHFLSLVFVPLILFLLDRTLERRTPADIAALSLAVGFQIIRGYSEVVHFTFLLIGITFLFRSILTPKEERGEIRTMQSGVVLLGALCLGIALASQLLLPILDHHLRSASARDINSGITVFASYSPRDIITLFVPSFFGFSNQTYWGDSTSTHPSLYLGSVLLVFACLALVIRRDRHILFLAAVAVITLLVSCGGNIPAVRTALHMLSPSFGTTPEPAYAAAIFNISVVLLAAFGLEATIDLLKSPGTLRQALMQRIKIFIIVIIAISSSIFTYLLLFRNIYFLKIVESGHTMTAEMRNYTYVRALLDAFYTLLLCSCICAMVLLYMRKRVSALLFAIAVFASTIVDLWIIDFNILEPQSRSDEVRYFAKSDAVIRIQADPEIFRIYPVIKSDNPDWYMYHKLHNVSGRSGQRIDIFDEFARKTGLDATLFNHTPPLFHKFWRVATREGRAVFRPVPPMFVSPEQIASDHAVLDMLNVKYIITNSELLDDYFEIIIDSSPRVYLNTNYLPRAFFADSLMENADRDSIFRFIKSGEFNPRKVAIVEESPPFSIYPADSNRVRLIRYKADSITFAAEVRKPTVLVLSELYYPQGWKVFVDGVESRMYRTNYLLRGVFLTPGMHMVHFAYYSRSFRMAQGISVASLVVIVGIFIGISILNILRRKKGGG